MEKQHRRNLLQKQNGENEVDHLRGSALESADGEKTGTSDLNIFLFRIEFFIFSMLINVT